MFLYFVKINDIEKITKPLAIKIINQPKYSDKKIWVFLNNSADRARLLKTRLVIITNKSTDVKNLALLIFSILDNCLKSEFLSVKHN